MEKGKRGVKGKRVGGRETGWVGAGGLETLQWRLVLEQFVNVYWWRETIIASSSAWLCISGVCMNSDMYPSQYRTPGVSNP